MNFAELDAWSLLLRGLVLVVLLRFVVGRVAKEQVGDFDKCALSVLSAVLLGAVELTTLVVFLVVAITTYIGVRRLHDRDVAVGKRILWLLIPLQLAPLIWFKYAHFIANDVMRVEFDLMRDVMIPAGISFYSFQLVAFAVDTLLHRNPVPRFIDFLNFAGFFPQIVAGPIERRDDLLPQIERFGFRWDVEAINTGARWIVLGLFMKACLADNLALYFRPDVGANAYFIWLNNLLFGLRIYLDFAGYSFIALGLASAFGIRLTMNFRSPYCAANIGDFWRRWHITLSQWFRDYVYLPLGGNRVARWRWNVLIVFVVSGVWHGAGWNFVVWGALHGVYLVAMRSAKNLKIPGFVSWSLCMLGVFFAWMFFYETRGDVLQANVSALFSPSAYGGAELSAFIATLKGPDGFVMCCFLALTAALLGGEALSLKRGGSEYRYCLSLPVLVVMVLLTVWLFPGVSNSFIYFAF